jgi:hypothetical protein
MGATIFSQKRTDESKIKEKDSPQEKLDILHSQDS